MDRSCCVLIVVPTYNECDNLRALVSQLASVVPDADLLIVDDNSPDGTGELAEALSNECPRIHVLHRPRKSGLGRAYIAGFRWGLTRHYEAFVQMDADLSHDPQAVPGLLLRRHEADVVLGSRYVVGGRTRNWGLCRRALSRLGSLYASKILSLPYRDLTSGFKCWGREALSAIGVETITSTGYSFQIEATWRAVRGGFKVVEEPIEFVERAVGRSKMSNAIIREAVGVVWRLRREAQIVHDVLNPIAPSGTHAAPSGTHAAPSGTHAARRVPTLRVGEAGAFVNNRGETATSAIVELRTYDTATATEAST